MGAMLALAIATIPTPRSKVEETLYQLLSGAVKVLNEAQAPLIGNTQLRGAELVSVYLRFGLS